MWCFSPLAADEAVPDSAKMSSSRASTVPFTLYVLILEADDEPEWEAEWQAHTACSQFSAYWESGLEERVWPWDTWAPWLDPVRTAWPRLGRTPPTPGGTTHEHVDCSARVFLLACPSFSLIEVLTARAE